MSVNRISRLSRRTAMRVWVTRAAPLLLLAACGGPSPATSTTVPTSKPAGAQPPAASPAVSPAASPASAASPAASPVAGPAASPVVAAGCVLTPEQTEGPYYIDVGLVRADITEGKKGVPLQLDLMVQDVSGCRSISSATVELWHCDALGVYSGFDSGDIQAQGEPPGSRPASPPPGAAKPGGTGGSAAPVNALTFLRGAQVSDSVGRVTFRTIYPGWYRGRTVHIHVKVHVSGQEVHTGQLYFDDAITDTVFTRQPYASRPNRDTRNANDGIFRQGGQQSTLALVQSGDGYTGTQTLVVRI